MGKLGIVYIMAADGVCDGLYKIGLSDNPEKRISVIESTKLPFRLSVLHTVSCGSAARDAEAILHIALQDFRVNGEWFKLSKNQVSTLVSCHTAEDVITLAKQIAKGP